MVERSYEEIKRRPEYVKVFLNLAVLLRLVAAVGIKTHK